MSDDPSSAFELICAEVERQLRGGEVVMDARAAFELLLDVRYRLDSPPRPSVIAHGALYEAVEAARARVYGQLTHLWHARCEVLDARRQQWLADRRDIRALLIDVLNVLLAAMSAAGVQHAYAAAERRAMVTAVVAEIRCDTAGVEAQREAVHRAAAAALDSLAQGRSAPKDADGVSPIDVIGAEVALRVPGEVATDAVAAGELMSAVRHLVDSQPAGQLIYGSLPESVRAARESVYGCLARRWQARRAITRVGRELRDPRALLVELESVVLEADSAAVIEQTYMRAEQRAMAAAVVAAIHGDTLSVHAQHEAVHRAAAGALHALQTLRIGRGGDCDETPAG